MTKKNITILILILVLGGVLFFVFKKKPIGNISENKPVKTEKNTASNDKKEQSFLIDGFPIDKVPLYKLTEVSSSKIFINTDPENISTFDDKNFAYYNVVFETEATQKEFFDYYKNLFESLIADETESREMVKGKIGEYRVSAAYYGENKTGYIQVHLANYQDENLNKYFIDYPEIFQPNEKLIEHEKSYGLLNQKGGEIEYTKYFTIVDSGDQNNDGKDDVDEFLELETEYKKQFQDKPEYIYDEESETIKWKDGEYDLTVSFSRDHGRIYVMLRKKL